MKKTFTTKIIPVLLAFVCLFCMSVPAFAAGNQTDVLFICKLDEGIETDQYSVVVVKLLNEDTMQTFTYKLYQYNAFSERYLMDNGVYSIVYAYIQGRNDVIFDIVSDEQFDIGFKNTIYFEMVDSNLLGHTERSKTTQPSTTATTTTKPVPSTLFPVYTTNNETTVSDKTDVSGTTETTTENESTRGDDTTGTTHISDETTLQNITEDGSTDITTQESTTTKQPSTFQKKLSVAFIVIAILVLILIMAFAVFYTKKKE